MIIRVAEVCDSDKLARVHVATWQAAYRGLVPDSFLENFTIEKRTAAFKVALETHSEETYLLEEGDLPIAILTVGPSRDEDLDVHRVGELWGIYIMPAWWRQGVGRRLVREAEQLLMSRGYEKVVLWVLEGNTSARRFYGAMGYYPDGVTKIVNLGVPLQAVRYAKQVNHASLDHE
jgi:ribosomal protein S18 acetylase RimI-like enzyme